MENSYNGNNKFWNVGDFIMGLFGGKDKYNYDEEAKLHELEIQKREIQDQQYESLLRENIKKYQV